MIMPSTAVYCLLLPAFMPSLGRRRALCTSWPRHLRGTQFTTRPRAVPCTARPLPRGHTQRIRFYLAATRSDLHSSAFTARQAQDLRGDVWSSARTDSCGPTSASALCLVQGPGGQGLICGRGPCTCCGPLLQALLVAPPCFCLATPMPALVPPRLEASRGTGRGRRLQRLPPSLPLARTPRAQGLQPCGQGARPLRSRCSHAALQSCAEARWCERSRYCLELCQHSKVDAIIADTTSRCNKLMQQMDSTSRCNKSTYCFQLCQHSKVDANTGATSRCNKLVPGPLWGVLGPPECLYGGPGPPE